MKIKVIVNLLLKGHAHAKIIKKSVILFFGSLIWPYDVNNGHVYIISSY